MNNNDGTSTLASNQTSTAPISMQQQTTELGKSINRVSRHLRGMDLSLIAVNVEIILMAEFG